MHRETKATAIPPEVKKTVFSRDRRRCVLCGSFAGGPHCHYIRRSQGGLGIEANIWTGCDACHNAFDSEATDGPLHEEVKAHLIREYPGWDESKLVYRKYGGYGNGN